MKKIILPVLLGALMCGVACGEKSDNNSQSTSKSTSVSSIQSISTNVSQSQSVSQQSSTSSSSIALQTSLEEFLTNYEGLALSFVQNNFKTSFINNKVALSETWYFIENSFNELTSVKLSYIYKEINNLRILETAEIVFSTPLDIDKIITGTLTNLDISGVTYRNEIFSWDAKQNFCQEDLKNALVEACGVEGTSYFREVENEDETKKSYEIAISNDENKTIVYSVEVENADSIEEIISNLADSEKTNVSMKDHFSLGDNQIDVSTYTQEEFQPENVQDLITNFDNDLHTALNEHFMPKFIENFLVDYNETKLIEPEWRIISNEENQITDVKLFTKYQISKSNYQVIVANAHLNEPIEIIEINDNNSENLNTIVNSATYSSEYTFTYNINKQNRDALMNAIFEAKGMGLEKPESTERFIVEVGSYLHTEVGETKQFKVMQLEKDKISQYTIFIKECNTDEQYLAMLQNQSNYQFSENFIELNLQGEALQYKELV